MKHRCCAFSRHSLSRFNDFHDVFGGPSRRYSSQDARHGTSSEARELSRYRGGRDGGCGDEEGAGAVMSGGVRRAGLGDRPVFGEEGRTNRRRYPSQDFFDDILGLTTCVLPTSRVVLGADGLIKRLCGFLAILKLVLLQKS